MSKLKETNLVINYVTKIEETGISVNNIVMLADIAKSLAMIADKLCGEQEPKTGRWLDWTDDRNDYLKCSICGYGEEGEVKFGEYTPYCPMCGAKMESEG